MSKYAEPSVTDQLFEQGMRPLRMYAPFMAAGAVAFGLTTVFLLAQSFAGVETFAQGKTGTVISMPVESVGQEVLVYAVIRPGHQIPEVECTLATTTPATTDFTMGRLSVHSRGRTLHPVAEISRGWRAGDALTCTSPSSETLLLGRNTGRTRLFQGLLTGFVTAGAGIMALVGFAGTRSQNRRR